jgi:hypothetical protein
MKKLISTIVLSTALASSLLACNNSDNCENKGPANGSQKLMSRDSDHLTTIGESLMDKEHWMQADAFFAQALAQNPSDLKAQFYRAVLKPFLTTKGLAARVKPLIRQSGNIGQYEAYLTKLPASPTKSFLLDGKEDITSIEQVQSLLVQQRQAFSDLRQFLKAHEDMELYLSSHFIDKKMNDVDFIVFIYFVV